MNSKQVFFTLSIATFGINSNLQGTAFEFDVRSLFNDTLFYIFLIVNKSFEKTKTNSELIALTSTVWVSLISFLRVIQFHCYLLKTHQ